MTDSDSNGHLDGVSTSDDSQRGPDPPRASLPPADPNPLTVGPPIRLCRTPPSVRTAAPELGQHTEEVLLEAGLDWDDITALREAGAFGVLANVSG
jgi:formyl-CoA transferase